jgi:hypothetical protein
LLFLSVSLRTSFLSFTSSLTFKFWQSNFPQTLFIYSILVLEHASVLNTFISQSSPLGLLHSSLKRCIIWLTTLLNSARPCPTPSSFLLPLLS